MTDEFDRRYHAVRSRDPRFDGRFFTAVTSTGIYCRPSCPAQTPKRENVRFYPVAAAAEAAGFRACRRCRPDTAPGSPEWGPRADLAARALRLIADGAVDTGGVTGLAHRLCVSERHLHRQLVAEVGVGPLALATTRRAQTARLLICSTALPLTDVAFAAGFASVRQFNEVIRASFGAAPSALRRRPSGGDPSADGALVVRLSYRPPLAPSPLLGFFAARAITGLEQVDLDVGTYRRTVRLPHGAGVIELRPDTIAHHVTARLTLADLRDVAAAVQLCRRLLDLDADPLAVADVLGGDPTLAPAVARYPGLRVPGAADGFELAVRAVLGQQVSVAAARTFAGRLVAALGTPLATPDGTVTHLFPLPGTLAEHDLAGIGLTRSRITTLRALGSAIASGSLSLDAGADRAQVQRGLLALPGIGPWTASYIAMRALGDPDAFPAADLGLRRAMERHGLDIPDLSAHAERWRPWRAYAAQYLWATLAEPAPGEAPLAEALPAKARLRQERR